MNAVLDLIGGRAVLIIAGIGAGAAAIGGIYWYGKSAGEQEGRVEQLQDSVDAYVKRQGIDDDVSELDRTRICIELGGLPDECKQLRGLEAR